MRVFLAFVLSILASSANAQYPGIKGGGSTVNNLTIFDQSPGCNTLSTIPVVMTDPTGYTLSTTTLTSSETTFILFALGDSVTANSGVAYSVVNTTKNQNLNPYNSLNYQAQSSMLGAAFGGAGIGGYVNRILDKLITAGKFARGILINVALGGNCASDYAKSGAMNQRLRVGCLLAQKFGWPISGSNDTWRMGIITAFGVNDIISGQTTGQFTTAMQSIRTSLNDYGCTAHSFVAKHTMVANVVNSSFQTAQAALVDSVQVFTGADRDSLTGAGNGDGTHLTTAAGNDNLAALWATIFTAHY